MADEADPAVEAEHALMEWMEPVVFTRKGVSTSRNLSRDFSDGFCVAEVIKHYIPKLVDIHNYHQASSSSQKIENWKTLNTKVLSKLDVVVPMNVVDQIVRFSPGVMQMVLNNIRIKVVQYLKPKLKADEGAPKKITSKLSPREVRSAPPSKIVKGHGAAVAATAAAATTTGVRRDINAPQHVAGQAHARGAGAAVNCTPADGGEGDGSTELLHRCVADYEEVNSMLLTKVKKLEALLKLKDKRILALERKCSENGIKP